MTYKTFADLIRFHTKTNSATLTDANLAMLATVALDDIAKEIAKTNEDFFGMTFMRDLIEGQREYYLPDEVLNNIKMVEATFDGTVWEYLPEFDLNLYTKPTNEESILTNFSHKPMFDIWGNSLYLYSKAIIDIPEGLKLWAIIYPKGISAANLSSETDMSVPPDEYEFGVPRQFHELIARRVIIDYKNSRDKPIPLTERESAFEVDLQKAVQAVRGLNLDRSMVASVPYNDGQNF